MVTLVRLWVIVALLLPGATMATYKLEAKWDGTNWTDETAYLMAVDIDRGRDGGPMGQAKTGEMGLTLRNDGKRFSPANAAGDLYGELLSNVPVRLRASYGRCVSLNGTTQYLQMPDDDAHFKITSQISFGAWVYPSGTNLTSRYMIGKAYWYLSYNPSGVGPFSNLVRGIIYTGGGTDAGAQLDSTAELSTTAWTFLVVVYDGTTAYLYVNGEEDASQATTGNITDSASKVTIGAWPDGTALFPGRVAYPFVYDRALSADEVRFMYNHGAAYIGLDEHLVGHWRFYHQDTRDSSDYAHTLTAVGSPTYPLASDLFDATLFTGYTHRFRPSQDQKMCALKCVDELSKMQHKTTQMTLQTNKTTGELIEAALTDYGFSATNRLVDDGASTIEIAGWSDKRASDICQTIAQAERGLFYIDAAGWALFEDRNHRRQAPHTAAQAVFDGAPLAGKASYELDDADVHNVIRVKAHPVKTQAATGVIWTLQPIPFMANGETRTFYAKFRDWTMGENLRAADITALVATTDYTANSQADGGGADRTANLAIVKTDYAEQSKLVLTASANLFVTKLQIRGKLSMNLDEVEVIEEDAASQALYGKRTLEFNSELLQDIDDAAQFALMLKARHNEPLARVGFVFDGHRDIYCLDAAMRLALSDRVDITDSDVGLADESYFIEAMNHHIYEGGLWHTVTLTLEPVVAEGYWILGVSKFDDETIVAF